MARTRKVEPKVVSVEVDLLVERDDKAPTDERFSLSLRELEKFTQMLRDEGGTNATRVLFRRRSDNRAYYLRAFVQRNR